MNIGSISSLQVRILSPYYQRPKLIFEHLLHQLRSKFKQKRLKPIRHVILAAGGPLCPHKNKETKKKNRQKAKSGHKAEIDKKHFRQEVFTLERDWGQCAHNGGLRG